MRGRADGEVPSHDRDERRGASARPAGAEGGQVCLFLIHSRLLLLWSSPPRVGVGVPILSALPKAGEARGGAVQPEAAEDARHHVGGHGEKNFIPETLTLSPKP